MAKVTDLVTLAKTSVASTDFLLISNSDTGGSKKLTVESMFPSVSTAGSSSETLYNSATLTNKNQIVFKGIKSGDTGLLTVATTSNNIVLTALEAGIDLSLCNNTTAGFSSGADFTGTVTGECGVTNGGTGLSTLAKGAVLFANATDTITSATMATNGQLLIGNTTNGYPSVATLTAGTNMTVTNGAGTITLAAAITNASANIDMYDGSSATYNIDLNSNNGWISGNGTDEGLTVDADGKVFVGEGTPTPHFSEALNIKGSIRFSNDTAPSIKPNATTSSTAGQKVTIEGGSSASGNAADLDLKGGTAASGGGNGGHVNIYGGSEAGGTAGSIKGYVYDGSGSAVQGLTVVGGSATPAVKVNAGNLIISTATKGIVHEGSGTVTQATDHTNGVTINATSGVITLAAVALAATTNAEFTVTNSTVQADSVILLTVQDENTTNNAQLAVATHTIGSGSFKISVVNPHSSGATSATASKIHFLIINNS